MSLEEKTKNLLELTYLQLKKNESALTAIELITTVSAFRFPRTHQMARYAGTIFALELVRTTGDILAMRRLFIVTIRTVDAAVTKPAFVDAGDTIVALEFGLEAQ